jgi:hypothetical protein
MVDDGYRSEPTDVDDDDDLESPAEPKFPMTVNAIKFAQEPPLSPSYRYKCGQFVSVRPCDEKFENKTYLGIFLGELALSLGYQFKPEDGVLTVCRGFYNPAILIPDMGEVVYGCGSWWGAIKKPEDLKKITDLDIENVWYVKALKALDTDITVEDRERNCSAH